MITHNRGRLDQLTVGADVLVNYSYDGLERMAIRTTQNMTPSGTTHYLYDLTGRLIAEASPTGTTITEYIWLDDLPLALFANLDTASPNLWYVHADHLGRPIKMTDAAKAVVWDAVYWPFGQVFAITGSAANNMRFPGQYFLLESGLAYNWHRHYDPALGRYLQPDPLGFIAGPSVYGYAEGNPINYTDLLGLVIEFATHGVFGYNHSLFIITPDNQALYADDPRFRNIDENGNRFATIGAGPDWWHKLVAEVNRERDVGDPTNFRSKLKLPCRYANEDEAIKRLFELMNNYSRDRRGTLYALFPSLNEGAAGYNSNGFISGLGQAAGFELPSFDAVGGNSTPGYQYPVPSSRFGVP